MMVEDLGIEAKEAAVREVAKLLPISELLQSIISSIKADYITRQQVLVFDEFLSHSSTPLIFCKTCLNFLLLNFLFQTFVLELCRCRANNSTCFYALLVG